MVRCVRFLGFGRWGWQRRRHRQGQLARTCVHDDWRVRCGRQVNLEVVEYDPEFWEEVEDSLEQFYLHCLLPELVDPRAPRGLPVREPEYILQVSARKRFIKMG